MSRSPLFVVLSLFSVWPLLAQQDTAFFESKIRPVLAAKCYACHSSKLKAPMGSLTLDTKAGVLQGGASGAAIVPGKPNESLLLKALTYKDPHVQMPPSGKLADEVIEDFRQWIAAGAPDTRVATTTASAALKGMAVEEGRKWWAFQPLNQVPLPTVRDTAWAKTPIDKFILAKLEEKKIKPSPAADRRTLARRVYVNLVGYKPTYEEVEAFAEDKSPDAYEKLIDRLLASEQYGEHWGRHWMDVARFGEDNPTGEATNPAYPFAWRYRDWIIEAVNKDIPYDRFVKLQLAADLMPDAPREDLRALGYLGAAPVYHKDLRLSTDVIGGFLTDDWDERVDSVSRGLLGLTVACARCHDHKFDPIPTKDYYGLVGVFASTLRAERPLFDVDPKVEQRYAWLQNRLFDLRYLANLLTNEASTVVDSAPRVEKWKAEIESLKKESETLLADYPQLLKSLQKYFVEPPRRNPQPPAVAAAKPDAPVVAAVKPVQQQPRRRGPITSTEPFTNAVFEASQYVDGSDPQVTTIQYKPGEPRDVPLLRSGNVANPGEIVPRHFPTVLAKSDPQFKNGSGRLELAERIFTDSAPLAARIMVNRIWGWHFGKPLVGTPSDFGVQGEKPTHPELLDYLASRFIAQGWSLKKLNRDIMLTAAYQQSSRPRTDAAAIDVTNSLVWRMNPRRLDVEAYRDTLLRMSGRLNLKMYGPSEDLQGAQNLRRTVYGRVSRSRTNTLLKTYDFPDPMQTAGVRDLTINPLQQLFVMNSSFMHDAAVELAKSVEPEPDVKAKVNALFRKALGRDPSANELDLALSYLAKGTIEQYAQVLLSANEEIFWP
jgi:hypothetical protein